MNACSDGAPSGADAWYILSTAVLPNRPYVKPAVCDISSPIVGGWRGASRIGAPFASAPAYTLRLANSGMCFAIGSDGFHLPSS